MTEKGAMTGKGRSRRLWLVVTTLVAAGIAVAAFVALTAAQTPTAEATEVGDRATAQVEQRTLRVVDEVDGELGHGDTEPLSSRRSGTLVKAPEAGDTIERGEALFVVDDAPVILLYGETPVWRPLVLGSSGDDVQQLEENLVELGYGDDLTVDTEFDDATVEAVEAWQNEVGLVVDGDIELGEVVFHPDAVWVATVETGIGSLVQPGSPVLRVASTRRAVSFDLPANLRDELAVGDQVDVELSDGSVFTAAVSEVSGVVETQTEAGGPGEQTVPVTLELPAGEATEASDGPVTVSILRQERADVVAVPVHALLALLEGGYAVEVVEADGSVTLVGVEVGLFADGWVEVTGTIEPGDEVIVP
ncbi:MAG: efflux RND transporter periplasmic adaptor subunit [Candidatus Limnocylindria bacterium]